VPSMNGVVGAQAKVVSELLLLYKKKKNPSICTPKKTSIFSIDFPFLLVRNCKELVF